MYLSYFSKMYDLLNLGGRLIITDCDRHNFFAKFGIKSPFASSIEKTVRSSQAGTEITQKKRLDYWESIRDVLADDLVFVDEMGVLLGLMRGMGRSKKGDRV